MYTSPTMDGAWLIIVSLKWFSLPQPNYRIPYIFGITLILEAQSDKTPVINVLFKKNELRKILIPAKCLLMAQLCPARGTFVLFKEQITQKGK